MAKSMTIERFSTCFLPVRPGGPNVPLHRRAPLSRASAWKRGLGRTRVRASMRWWKARDINDLL
jgi:hypothetical protein